MSLWRRWRAQRQLRRRAASYVDVMRREPAADRVRWLADHATRGDADHARWELRYARWALGLLVAERDSLDDGTPSAVARALTAALARDPNVAAGKLDVAQRQLNARIRRYRQALLARESGEPTSTRLGRELLTLCGAAEPFEAAAVAAAGATLAEYAAEANELLRVVFGVATLPEHDAPSTLARPGTGRR